MIALFVVAALSAAAAHAPTTDGELIAHNSATKSIDARNSVVFGLRWRTPVVRTGVFREVGISFGSPGLSERYQLLIVGTGEGVVEARTLKDGEVRWSYQHGAPFEAGVAIVPNKKGELAILGARDGSLLALEVASGKLRWKVTVDGDPRAAPVLADDRLVVTTANNKVAVVGVEHGNILWTHGRPPPTSLTIAGHGRAAVDHGTVYAGFSDGYVEAYDLNDGGSRWSRPLSLSGGDFVDADADPFVADGRLYAASYVDGVYALNAADGSVIWQRTAPAITSIARADDRLVAASADGFVWGLALKDGALAFRTRIPIGPVSRQVVKNDLVTFTCGDSGLLVLSAKDGRPLQATGYAQSLASDPVWVHEHLALLSSAGYLYLLGLNKR